MIDVVDQPWWTFSLASLISSYVELMQDYFILPVFLDFPINKLCMGWLIPQNDKLTLFNMLSPDYDHSDDSLRCLTDLEKYSTSITSGSIKAVSSQTSSEDSELKSIEDEDDLPPVDGGIQAWLFLIAAAMLEALVWGKSLGSSVRSNSQRIMN